MKKVLIILSLCFLNLSIGICQSAARKLYEDKQGEFICKIEIKVRSEDIIEYSFNIHDEAGKLFFQQEGFALDPNLIASKKAGLDSEEGIQRADGSFVGAVQYTELCNCRKFLAIVLAKDLSCVTIIGNEALLKEIFGDKANSFPWKQSFGTLCLKN
jgi:hypothetical protein